MNSLEREGPSGFEGLMEIMHNQPSNQHLEVVGIQGCIDVDILRYLLHKMRIIHT